MGLRGIFDDLQPQLARCRENGPHIGGLAIQMHRDHRLDARLHGGAYPVGGDVVGGGIRLDRDRDCPALRHSQPGGDIGI